MIDVRGYVVVEGDILVWDRGDVAYVYRIVDGEAKIIADWQIGSLGLNAFPEVDWNLYPESMREFGYSNYQRVINRKIDELVHAPKRFSDIVNSLNEDKPHVALGGSIESPIVWNDHDDDEDEEPQITIPHGQIYDDYLDNPNIDSDGNVIDEDK